MGKEDFIKKAGEKLKGLIVRPQNIKDIHKAKRVAIEAVKEYTDMVIDLSPDEYKEKEELALDAFKALVHEAVDNIKQ